MNQKIGLLFDTHKVMICAITFIIATTLTMFALMNTSLSPITTNDTEGAFEQILAGIFFSIIAGVYIGFSPTVLVLTSEVDERFGALAFWTWFGAGFGMILFIIAAMSLLGTTTQIASVVAIYILTTFGCLFVSWKVNTAYNNQLKAMEKMKSNRLRINQSY